MTKVDQEYSTAICRAADLPRAYDPVQLHNAQSAMWARHKVAAWQGAPIGALNANMIRRSRSNA